MSSSTSRRFARAMKLLQETDPDTYTAVRDHTARLKSEARSYRLQVPTSPSRSKEALDDEVHTQSVSPLTSEGGH